MTRVSNPAARSYDSPLRAQQAEETRGRILDAAVRVMARGIASLSVPAVAREAGVSVPTVYRHFGTKNDLIVAVYPHLVSRAGLNKLAPPRSMDELRAGLRALFSQVESFDDLARAVMASPAADEARRLTMPDRIAMFHAFADSIEPKLSSVDRDRIARLVLVMTSSASMRMWRDHLGLSVDAAVDDVDWVIRAAVAAATTGTGR